MNLKSAIAEQHFRKCIAELGGICLYETWKGTHKPHHVKCVNGHDCYPYPGNVYRTHSICGMCRKPKSIIAEKQFRERVAELGGICLYETWEGIHRPHHVKCVNNHDSYPHPANVQQGHNICYICPRPGSQCAEKEFRARVERLGGICLYKSWQGVTKPHHARCINGHDCYPRPNDIQQGHGICNFCAWRNQDCFYLIYNPHTDIYKLGITTDDPNARLSDHKTKGFTEVVKLYRIPSAIELEQYVLAEFAKQGYKPVYGKEYFREPEDWRPIYAWLDTEVEKRGGIPIPI